jgi:hypothetical protein
MHVYAFGSVCRGQIDSLSDIDMLAIVNGRDDRFNPNDYSIYSYARISELWKQGNPFAWHLYLESKLIYASDDTDFIRDIGNPTPYKNGYVDCLKFYEIFLSAKESIDESNLCEIFDLSSVFLGIRNFATCYSLHSGLKPDFSRNAARNLGNASVPIDESIYENLEKARVLCTRGLGELLTPTEIFSAKRALGEIESWMSKIIQIIESTGHERV